MTKKEIFAKAHKMAKEIKKEFPTVNYRAQFALCLKELHKEANKQTKEENKVPSKMVLGNKEVSINGIPRRVCIVIKGDCMLGMLNETKFIWRYLKHSYPHVQVSEGVDGVKAAKYGRLYILERLKMDSISLPIKTMESAVSYIHLDTENGVWCNCFVNGYIRGEVDGTPFAWNAAKYKEGAYVTEAGNKGHIAKLFPTDRVRKRLKAAGINTFNEMITLARGKQIKKEVKPAITDISKVGIGDVGDSVTFMASGKEYIKYHKDGSIIYRDGYSLLKYSDTASIPSRVSGILSSLYDSVDQAIICAKKSLLDNSHKITALQHEIAIEFANSNCDTDFFTNLMEQSTIDGLLDVVNSQQDKSDYCVMDAVNESLRLLQNAANESNFIIEGQLSAI